ncbi:MAG: hypothetical protein AAF236_16910, partial [Verrucomicrobiota bacterium]
MSDVENSLRETLNTHPEDWAIRFLLVDKYVERGAVREATDLILEAPNPPASHEHLTRAVDFAGVASLPIVEAYVHENRDDHRGYDLAASLNRAVGNADRADEFAAASASLTGQSYGEAISGAEIVEPGPSAQPTPIQPPRPDFQRNEVIRDSDAASQPSNG